jgi:hypothetical protein
MDMPSMFSKLLGEETPDLERLISRGCCISWSPKNLASAFLTWSIRWMVDKTPFRLFTTYSDPAAKELGTINQACNCMYLGKTHGTEKQYRYQGEWVSDRRFRQRSTYRRYANELGISWQSYWEFGDRVIWTEIPDDIEAKLRQRAKEHMAMCEVREVPPKHKYFMVLGQDG